VLSQQPDFTTPHYSAWQAVAMAQADGVADLLVEGLLPNTGYYYRIEVDGQLDDRIGRFTTFGMGRSALVSRCQPVLPKARPTVCFWRSAMSSRCST
jgi:phosphodiesterase/alkaline phosphatase D-like protein